MTKKIVFINQATGYLTIDIINEFVKKFDEVALITGSIRIQDTLLDKKVFVSKITRYDRGSIYKKAFSWIIGTCQIQRLLTFKYRGYEKFFFTIPPTAYLLALRSRLPFSIAIYDLYPEALKANGFSENGILFKWWVKKNSKIFAKAHRIYTLSENMAFLARKYAAKAEVRVISNWTAFSGFVPIKKDNNRIAKEEDLINKFVIQYSGNIGVTHNVETLLEVAEVLKSTKDLVFQIIGRGDRSNTIKELIEKNQLTNCRLLDFRNDEELYESLCAADLAVITLDDKTTDISVPSKTYNIMAAGLPVMAITPLNSSVSKIIMKYGIGKAFDKSDVAGMCEFVLEIINNPVLRNKLAENSHAASQNFTRTNAALYLEHYTA